jgi:hypothetical protein
MSTLEKVVSLIEEVERKSIKIYCDLAKTGLPIFVDDHLPKNTVFLMVSRDVFTKIQLSVENENNKD